MIVRWLTWRQGNIARMWDKKVEVSIIVRVWGGEGMLGRLCGGGRGGLGDDSNHLPLKKIFITIIHQDVMTRRRLDW